jgi:hypothetical protein
MEKPHVPARQRLSNLVAEPREAITPQAKTDPDSPPASVSGIGSQGEGVDGRLVEVEGLLERAPGLSASTRGHLPRKSNCRQPSDLVDAGHWTHDRARAP